MDKEEIIRRLKKISEHAVHVTGEPPFIMSLDDGIALDEAIRLLKEQEPMRVLYQRECETMPGHYERKGFCPECHQVLEWYLNRSYCGFCGQAVKWDE